jgi:hypothetical protein
MSLNRVEDFSIADVGLVCRRGVYFFQIRVPDGLVPCGVMPPIRVRLGRLPRREAQRLALRLHVDAADAFAQRRWQMRQQNEQAESETGNVGSEQWIAGMQDMLAAGLARLQNPTPPFHPTPSDRRTQAAFQEILSIEHEIKKGPTCNPVIAERADLLRKDVWDRWRDGEGIAPAATDPLTQAISKLTDVADRQLSLLAPVASPTTIHQLAAAPAIEVDRSTASGEPRDPPSATLAQMVSTAPLFSQLVDEYLAMRASACAEPGAVSTHAAARGDLPRGHGRPPARSLHPERSPGLREPAPVPPRRIYAGGATARISAVTAALIASCVSRKGASVVQVAPTCTDTPAAMSASCASRTKCASAAL